MLRWRIPREEAEGIMTLLPRVRHRCAAAYQFRSLPSLAVLAAYFQFFVLGLIHGVYSHYTLGYLNVSSVSPRETIGVTILIWSLQFLFSGITAKVGERYGRWRVIFIGWNVIFLSCSATALTSSAGYGLPASQALPMRVPVTVIIFVAQLPLYLGLSFVWVNLLLLGVDVQGAVSGDQISSYYHWFYWSKNLGFIVSLFFAWVMSVYYLAVTFTVVACFVWVALLIHFLLPTLNTPTANEGSPIVQVWNIVKFVMKKVLKQCVASCRKRDHVISEDELRSINSLAEPPSLFDCAKTEYHGTFGTNYVDEVKKFFYVVFLTTVLFGYFAVYSLMITSYLYQSERLHIPNSFVMTRVETHVDGTLTTWTYTRPISLLSLTAYIIVFVAVPLLDLLVYPCAGAYAPTIIMRVGIGLCFAFCSSATALATECARFYYSQYTSTPVAAKCSNYNVIQPLYDGDVTWYCTMEFSFMWLLPQFIFLGLAETFINIGAFEFVSGNAPSHMKAVLMGLLFTIRGAGYIAASLMVLSQTLNVLNQKADIWCYFCDNSDTSNVPNSLLAYFVMLVLLCVCAVLFIWVYASQNLKFSVRAEEQYEKMMENVFLHRKR